jgi:hypothetical protein
MDEKESSAEQVARTWLGLTDHGDAQRSWETSAHLFRQAVTPTQWAQSLAAARGPLGAVVTRTLQSARATTELPGAPDGEYVVLQFASSFEHKRSATETVTPMRDPDGEWRVSGYFIR